jgi:hypothetical protein
LTNLGTFTQPKFSKISVAQVNVFYDHDGTSFKDSFSESFIVEDIVLFLNVSINSYNFLTGSLIYLFYIIW